MAFVKISELPAGSSVASTDLFESSQGAGAPYTSRSVTGTQVRSFVLGGPVAIPADVVNYVSVSGGALGTTPTLATISSGTDVGLRLQSKGQGRTALTNDLGTLFSCGPNGAITPVNNILAIATATNSAPALVAEGSDTNIGLSLGTKGSGFMLLSMGAGGVLQLAPGGSEKVRVDANGYVGIGTTNPVVSLNINYTDAVRVPVGTTAQRPTGATGYLRFNSSTSSFEGFNGSAWGSIGGGATGGGNDKIFTLNDQTVTTNYTIPSGQNAGTFGPVTVASGITVTVPSGSTWTVV